MKNLRVMAGAALIVVFVLLGIAPPVQGVQEIALDYNATPYEVNRDSSGKLYVSDAGTYKIWQLNPGNDTFQSYPIGRIVRDAQPDSGGRIWWTDGSDTFGYVLSGSTLVYKWTLTSDPPYTLQALAPDNQGGVWLGEVEGGGSDNATSRLFYFDTHDNSICVYRLPNGTFTHDMVYHDGYLYLGQWVYGQIFRITPGEGSITYTFWQVGSQFEYGPWGIAVDGSYVWWADYFKDVIARLNISNNMATFYSLKQGASPRMITINNGKIWFTQENYNLVSILTPSSASGEDMMLDAYTDNGVGGDCSVLGSATTSNISIASGDITWDASAANLSYDQDGWQIYQLPGDALPFGVASTAGHVWVGDQGRHLLLRFDTQAKTFIPAVLKFKKW